jgi:O-antigen/teichoic acid export membrane protein
MTAEQEPRLVRQNVLYSVFDYLSQPAMMVLAAPVLLRTLGAPQYGAWMLVNSIAATASGLGGGFGDGATKFIAMYRGRCDREGVARSLVASLAINCALGLLLAIGLAAAAPWLIGNVFQVEPPLRHAGITAVRISAFVLLLRFVEAVFVSAIRAFERYRPVVVTSVSARVLMVALAVLWAARGFGLVRILWATLAVESAALISLSIIAGHILEIRRLPKIDVQMGVRELCGFGIFTWLRSATGVLFGYVDRLMVAAVLGTGPLAFFVLCNQLTQPIPALMASGFNFIFPNLSARSGAGEWRECRRRYRMAVLVSVCLVVAIGLPVILLAGDILTRWLGPVVALKYKDLLILMTLGNGLLAVSVVPHYTAMALGRARALAFINLVAGVVSLAGGYVLLRHFGLLGGGFIRVLAGLVSLSMIAVVRSALEAAPKIDDIRDQQLAVAGSLDLVSS